MTDTPTPRTEAGRHYVARCFGRESGNVTMTEAKMVAEIRAIEREAAAPLRAAIQRVIDERRRDVTPRNPDFWLALDALEVALRQSKP